MILKCHGNFSIYSVVEEAAKSTSHVLMLSEQLWSTSLPCEGGNSISDYLSVV